MGLKACTFVVYSNVNETGVEMVSIEAPEEGSKWRLVELRPVSEGIVSSHFQSVTLLNIWI
jgi:hypothetical protein